MHSRFGAPVFLMAMVVYSPAEGGQQAPSRGGLTGEELIRKVEPSVVLILAGAGGGRLTGAGTGFVIGSNGLLLTAYHLIKGAQEVQVRMTNGEVYDRVELVGFDERRGVAALHIPASGLPELATVPANQITEGESAFVVSNADGRRVNVTDAIITGMRLADQVPNAGTGYRVLQFLTSVPASSSGSVLVEAKARALGVVAASTAAGTASFAIPLESVVGLATAANRTELGSGKDLQLPQSVPTALPAAASPGAGGTSQALRAGQKIFLTSKTVWFKAELLQQALYQQPEFVKSGLLLVTDPKLADLIMSVDRPFLTYDFTFTLTNPQGSIVFASGKVTSVDGRTAAPKLAAVFAEQIRSARGTH